MVGDVFRNLHLALFQLVDLVVNGFQLGLVRGAEILPARHPGDRPQGLFVDLDLGHHRAARGRAVDVHGGVGRHALGADADRVDADTLRLGDLGRRLGCDLAAVVHAVGQQDDYLRLGLALAQAVDRRCQAVADRRAVFDQAAADARQQGLQRPLVGGQGALREGLACECHQSDPVAVAVGDERSGHLLGRRDAVGPEVACQHRARDVDRQHDVDALGVRVRKPLHVLRARQCHDQQRECRRTQHERQVPQVITYGLRGAHDTVDRRDLYRRPALQRPPDVVAGHRYECRQQPQIVW